VDERALAERLISYDTSKPDQLRAAAAFVKGWLESREVDVSDREYNGLPVVLAEVGPQDGPVVVLHGHLDVVPAFAHQFTPRVEGDRLIGRGAYDMKGALAAMMCALPDAAAQDAVGVRLLCVPDEESEDVENRSTDAHRRRGPAADFAITGEPTDLHIGVQAKGVLAVRVEVSGTAAHGSTPWLGDNAILKAHDAFRRIETLPFSRQSSDLFDRPVDQPRPDRGRRRLQQGPRPLLDGRRHPLPAQPGHGRDPRADPADPGLEIVKCFTRARDRLAPERLRAGAARRRLALHRGRGALRGARRRVRRHLVPGGGHPGRGVRPRRRRPSRP
jgi:succinyl-diaminopimelate desuccinylase